MKGKVMTLKQAEAHLKETDHPFSVVTIRKAVTDKKLKAIKNEAPIPYYTVNEDDLMAWATDSEHHRPGRKTE